MAFFGQDTSAITDTCESASAADPIKFGEFNRSSRRSARGDAQSRLCDDLWLIWTFQHLGQAIPADVLARARAEPRGDWPRPAAAMLVGVISPEQALAGLEAKTGDDRDLVLTEGYFFAGQFALAHGDTDGARRYFERTRALGILMYTEYVAAGFELDRMAAAR